MAGQLVVCSRCNCTAKTKMQGSALITIALLCFGILPGIIYMIWRRVGMGVCSNCGSSNVVTYAAKKSQANQNTQHVIHAQEPQMRCPECHELILVGARKCKHCQAAISEGV